jgi:hypothetical protein
MGSPGSIRPWRVDDEAVVQWPAPPGLGLDPLDLALGHARIVLERHGEERCAAMRGAHEAGEARDGTAPRSARR